MIKIETFVNTFVKDFVKRVDNSLIPLKETLEIRGPTFRKRTNNITVSYNIIPKIDLIEHVWNELTLVVGAIFTQLSKSGEIITYSAENGSILDQGVEYFKVLKSKLFECYIYEPESFIYARLLLEYDKIKKNQWFSIDLDAIDKSAWFEE